MWYTLHWSIFRVETLDIVGYHRLRRCCLDEDIVQEGPGPQRNATSCLLGHSLSQFEFRKWECYMTMYSSLFFLWILLFLEVVGTYIPGFAILFFAPSFGVAAIFRFILFSKPFSFI
ncbi:hypothetical protein EUGRSUZ_H01430 [Eucalyptus grandis]|uniref:Uncharacterized protein n=2 Tax=Eucalyptus grandis TaxID=71139 RepID=A0A059AXT9_EUCGR|nr:hypothetical protein EUGRSUZ_H01430 [Eucalyptus grandis]